jgi:hypothetical protein
MNRDSRVVTARAQVTGADPQVLAGPWELDSVKDWKHKYSMIVYNRGNVDHQGYDLVVRAEYDDGTGTYQTAPQPDAGGNAQITVKSQAEKTMEFYIPKGVAFRLVGWGVGGDTEGRIEMIEVPFESNISDR